MCIATTTKKQVRKKTAFEYYVYAPCLSSARTAKEIQNQKYTWHGATMEKVNLPAESRKDGSQNNSRLSFGFFHLPNKEWTFTQSNQKNN